MKRVLLTLFLSVFAISYQLALASGQPKTPEPVGKPDCAYDRKALLELDQDAFDQDMNGGWRAVARREACTEVAADLIRDYRETKGVDLGILYWHECQLRATAGETEEAIRLFKKARHPRNDDYGWNLYVDATVAFLRGDKAALLNAREMLSRLPQPSDFQPVDQAGNAVDVS